MDKVTKIEITAMEFPQLNLPSFDFSIKQYNHQLYIFDNIRRKYIKLTPEEWVRQNFLKYLIDYKGYPQTLISVEQSFTYANQKKRTDIQIYNRNKKLIMIVECKAPSQNINNDVFDQIFIYNRHFNAPYLAITNGYEHYCCYFENRNFLNPLFLNEIPNYTFISETLG